MRPLVSRAASVATACGLLALGCGGGDSSSDAGFDAGEPDAGPFEGDAGPGGPRVVLGTGTTGFVPIPLTGAPEMDLIRGPQGGWHVHASVRLHELDIDGLVLTYEIQDADGVARNFPSEIVLSERRLMREGDHWLRVGDRVIFDITEPAEVEGSVMRLRAIADPPGGDPVEDERTVTIGMEIGGPAPG